MSDRHNGQLDEWLVLNHCTPRSVHAVLEGKALIPCKDSQNGIDSCTFCTVLSAALNPSH
jgi:hypothetical protein